MRRSRRVPGWKTAGLLSIAGVVSFVLILKYRDPAAPLSEALAPAVQALFAAVVAAFGITQMLIAREAMQVARRTVAVTQEQTDVMRQQVVHAEEDSAQRAWEAEQALSLARIERLDGHAPQVALVVANVLFAPEPRWDDVSGEYSWDRVYERENLPWPNLLYTTRFELINYGDPPVTFSVEVNDPHFVVLTPQPWVARPGKSEILIQREHSPQEWVGYANEHESNFRKSGDDSFLILRVSVEGPSRFVRDVHELRVGPPPIREVGDRIEVTCDGRMKSDELGSISRYYIATSV
jgi:hypothetical protein